jgi:choline kinase
VSAVRDAVVLAAGNGDRFVNGTGQSKLLEPVLGVPLILRTLDSARVAGITRVDIVLGYRAEQVRAAVERATPVGMVTRFHLNADWHKENGLSVLAVRHEFGDRRFALLMGDHVFDPAALTRLLAAKVGAGESLLAIDRRPALPEIAAEATRVRLDGDRIVAIGKNLDPYDALDTGMFVCAPTIFEALAAACAAGDTTLSAGVRRLATDGLVRGIDIGDALWRDIDTVDDLQAAETILFRP